MSTQKKSLVPPKTSSVPARTQIAVNKSVIQLAEKTKTKKGNATMATDGDKKLDDIFAETLEIAVALIPTVSFAYASQVRKWLAKLLDPALPKPKRNAYLSFMVFQMQNLKISEPFDQDPPPSLGDAGKLFNAPKLKKMLAEMENKNLMEHLKDGLTPHGLSGFRADFKTPVEFFDDQLLPSNGIVAYGGCFSNHFF